MLSENRWSFENAGMIEQGKSVTVKDLLKVLYERACQQKLWGLVRHTAGILGKRVEDLAKAVTDLLVRQKQVKRCPESNRMRVWRVITYFYLTVEGDGGNAAEQRAHDYGAVAGKRTASGYSRGVRRRPKYGDVDAGSRAKKLLAVRWCIGKSSVCLFSGIVGLFGDVYPNGAAVVSGNASSTNRSYNSGKRNRKVSAKAGWFYSIVRRLP